MGMLKKNTSGMIDIDNEIEKYCSKTKGSRSYYEEALRHFPGGNTRSAAFFTPYPPYIIRGEGCQIYDVDGNVWVDFNFNYTSLIVGYSNKIVIEAVNSQLNKITCVSSYSEGQNELAEIIKNRLPSIEMLRFANSGSEAVLHATRAARAFTGKDKIAKFEGAYHGSHDEAEISVSPPLNLIGKKENPKPFAECKGIPKPLLKNMITLPYNDIEIVEKIVKKNKDNLAAVIVEPVMNLSGFIEPQNDFLKSLREVTNLNDVLLIFDEVISFRIARGGAQGFFNVRPDLTTLGKIIGGGFPIGAFGGKREIMEFLKDHSGTFNANPISMVAGIAAMKQLTDDVIQRLSNLGQMARDRINRFFLSANIPGQATGMGSLFRIHFSKENFIDYRTFAETDTKPVYGTFLALVNRGVMMTKRLSGCIAIPTQEKDVKLLVDKLEEIFG